MISALLAACCLLAQDEPAGAFDWARALDDLDLSVGWGDFSAELTGELELDLLVFGKESPGTTLEDPVLRSNHYKRTRIEDGPEGLARFSLFLDGGFQDWLTYEVEGRVDRGEPAESGEAVGARLEQYWVRASAPEWTHFNLELGKFAAPVGNFIPRSSARKNPLTTWPLIYDQNTTFMKKVDTPAAVLGRRDRPDVKDWRVPIYRELYGVGGMVFGTWKDLTVSVAVMNTAPGSWVFQWPLHAGDFRDPNCYLHLGYAIDASWTVGASLSRGPYDRRDAGGIPAGRNTGDFPQTLAGADLSYALGDLQLFAEAYWTRFKAPLIDDLDLWSWYVEAKYTILPGLFSAVRLAQMVFGEIDDAAGVPHQWDRNLVRVEFGGGYFFTRNLFTKATMQLNYTMGGREPHDHLFMLQAGLTF
ncbi:MAG: hypothetical protein JO332_09860 [Planctomycetaceae bacterium]|nr:hypothetical protein [Planctomycetaceae bacterium]